MSITLQSASGVNVVFNLAKQGASNQVFQNIGTSYQDTKLLSASQNIGSTGTAKTRVPLKVPYTYTEGSVSKTDYMYFVIESTVPASAPLAEVDKGLFMLGTLAVHSLVKDLVKERRLSQS